MAASVNRPVEAVGKVYKQQKLCNTSVTIPRYKYFDISQGLFLTAYLEQQLKPGSFEQHTVNYLIDRAGLSSFDAAFHNDKTGDPAYSPGVTLKIIFSCYSRGIITGRPIEYACKTNIIVKAFARGAESGYDTITRFISGQAEAVKDLFPRRRPRVTRRGSSGENCSP
ncbi:MAG: transposase [Treponema sp.]|jgi:hypothetical protein|nr:transposase [Treponema sp.]